MNGNNFTDKISDFVGKAKEVVGDAINNEELATKGRAEQSDTGQDSSVDSPNGEPNFGAEKDFNAPIVRGNDTDSSANLGEETFSGNAEDVEVVEPVGSEPVPEAEVLPPLDDPGPADLPEGFEVADDPLSGSVGNVGDAGDFDTLDDETRFVEGSPDASGGLFSGGERDYVSDEDVEFVEDRDVRF